MKKRMCLCCVASIAVTAKYATLIGNDFITCSITEKAKPMAVIEINPLLYVELNNEVGRIIPKEAIKIQENNEALLKETGEVQKSIEPTYTDYDTPPDNSFKSYMDYRTITDTTSKQYELQKQADTNWCGMRIIDEKYCIAVGSYYSTTVGQAVDIIMENENTIHCIVADLKQDIHTDVTNRQNPNGSVIEFLVDIDVLHRQIQKAGDISYFDTVWKVNLFAGEINTIRVYE
ncbi:MAG: hypothetical protein K1W19_07660 [Lachnospiraceae bacterium]